MSTLCVHGGQQMKYLRITRRIFAMLGLRLREGALMVALLGLYAALEGFGIEYVEYNANQFAERTGVRESLKRALFRTGAGRMLRRLVVFLRLGLPIDWVQKATAHLRPTRRDVYYWIGTDVLRLIESVETGTLPEHSRTRICEAVNLAVAPHLVGERRADSSLARLSTY